MPTVRTRDGVNLYVKDWGQGRPVILIHGWPLNADMWEAQAVALLEAGFRVISYDRRGFGRSDQPAKGYDYDTLAADLEAVIEQSGAEHPALVGFSMGGGEIARYLGKNGPGAISKAVFLASVVPGILKSDSNPDGAPASAFDEIVAGLKKDRPHFLAGFLKTVFGVNLISHPVSQETLDWALQGALMASPVATTQCAYAFGETDFTRDLRGFQLPVLAMHGKSDTNVPITASSQRLKTLVPHTELVEVDGAPHGLTATHADAVNRELVSFLRR